MIWDASSCHWLALVALCSKGQGGAQAHLTEGSGVVVTAEEVHAETIGGALTVQRARQLVAARRLAAMT